MVFFKTEVTVWPAGTENFDTEYLTSTAHSHTVEALNTSLMIWINNMKEILIT